MNLADKAHLVLPLIAAMLFAMSALAMRAAASRQAGVASSTLMANVAAMLGFGVFIDWSARPFLPEPLMPCVILGVLFFVGQIFTVLALSRGAVSVAAPVMSSKVIMVAFILAFQLSTPPGWPTWVAAVLVMLGIACMQGGQSADSPAPDKRRVMFAIVFALIAALAFATYDVLTQVYSKQMEFHRVVPFGMVVTALLSLLLLPFMDSSVLKVASDRMLLVSVILMTLQSLLIVASIGKFGDAANINIVYSSRGIWSVLFAWLIGAWFGVAEVKGQTGVAVRRLTGAAIILAAIILVVALDAAPKP